jgi:hypothetical protein
MRILVKFPTRGRPVKFSDTFARYVEYAEDLSNLSFLVTMDADDKAVTMDLINQTIQKHPATQIIVGHSANKIAAVNRDMPYAPPFDILLLASDDMVPQVKGYDTIIRKKMQEHFPDTDGVLWFNDGYMGHKLNTLCILGRKYYQRFGYIYNPAYRTAFCDNEFMDTANRLKRQVYDSRAIIKHMHPNNGVGHKDSTYIKNDSSTEADRMVYQQRKYGVIVRQLPLVRIRGF